MSIPLTNPEETGPAQRFPAAQIRILETTDLHMQMLPYDYFADQQVEETGLINLAADIEELRAADDVTTLLFDNGDFLQGNPLADFLAAQSDPSLPHPLIAAFNTLQYDAVTLGNHEFNYGIEYLRSVLADAEFPVVCGNIQQIEGPPLAAPFAIVKRSMRCSDGAQREIRIGVIGFVPPQINDWDRPLLDGKLIAGDIITAAKGILPQVKAAGADLIVALCHSGIGHDQHAPEMENAAVPLAALPGIDVILTGHTHGFFPGRDFPQTETVDPVNGTLHGKPAVMAGFCGNRLGIVDLSVTWDGQGWHVARSKSQLRCNGGARAPQTPLQTKLHALVEAPHLNTLVDMRKPICHADVPIHNYFAAFGPDQSQQLLAGAKRSYVTRKLQGSSAAALPLVVTTVSFRTGGVSGPGNYVHIAPGPVTMRDAAAIYPFSNVPFAVRRSGAQLRDWVERAASHFAQVTPGEADQPLINPLSLAYNCDMFHGLTYRFDLTKPARFGPDGQLANPEAWRVCDLASDGELIEDDAEVIVVSNSYRANGGGGFERIPNHDVIFAGGTSTREILIDYLRDFGAEATKTAQYSPIMPCPGTSATFLSAPDARHHLPAHIDHLGAGPNGFDRYRYNL